MPALTEKFRTGQDTGHPDQVIVSGYTVGTMCNPLYARLVVRVGNSHDVLVASARECMELLNNPNAGEFEANRMIKKIRTMLAKIEAEE